MSARHVRLFVVASLATTLAAACARGGAEGGAGGAPAADAGPKLPAGVTLAMIAQGDSIFHGGSCVRCHGKGGIGAQNGPAINTGTFQHSSGSVEDITKTIITGVPKEQLKDQTRRFPMRANGGIPNLTADQAKALAAYVWSLSHKVG